MGKMKKGLALTTALIAGVFASNRVMAEDIFINCADGTTNVEQCGALYSDQAFLPTAIPPLMQTPEASAAGGVANGNFSDVVINATPNADDTIAQKQIVFRDTAAPLAISQPVDEMEELGSEYAFYKTPSGGLVVERDVTQEEMGDGSTIQTTRTTETSVTPPYVEMPSISAHKRMGQIAYGDNVQDWEANNGDSLRTLLIEWGQKSGWTVVWKLDRDYILEAGVVFRGTFTEVASAIIRTFARAVPAPIGTFYKGNRVLVINTQEDDNA